MRNNLVALICIFGAIGCTATTAVEGTVKYKGESVSDATVSFFGSDGDVVASATTDSTGKFKLLSPQGKDRIPNGSYRVTVFKRKASTSEPAPSGEPGKITPEMMKMMKNTSKKAEYKSALPEKFNDLKQSGISVSLPSSTPIVIDLGS